MRIISGIHKGRRISAPKKLPVRPTTDMAKEALFNILHNAYYFEDLAVLDLYAGTGNISYEFASRGSTNIVAVDANHGCVKFIEETSRHLDLPIAPVKREVAEYLEHTLLKFDIIFADPPYDMELSGIIRIHELVFGRGLLNENGLLIIEHSKHINLSELPHFRQERKYGGSRFSFFGEASP